MAQDIDNQPPSAGGDEGPTSGCCNVGHGLLSPRLLGFGHPATSLPIHCSACLGHERQLPLRIKRDTLPPLPPHSATFSHHTFRVCPRPSYAPPPLPPPPRPPPLHAPSFRTYPTYPTTCYSASLLPLLPPSRHHGRQQQQRWQQQ